MQETMQIVTTRRCTIRLTHVDILNLVRAQREAAIPQNAKVWYADVETHEVSNEDPVIIAWTTQDTETR